MSMYAPDTPAIIARGRHGREAAQPIECSHSPRCYVRVGRTGLLADGEPPMCADCGGVLLDLFDGAGG